MENPCAVEMNSVVPNGQALLHKIEPKSAEDPDLQWKEVAVSYGVDESPPFGLCILLAFQVCIDYLSYR